MMYKVAELKSKDDEEFNAWKQLQDHHTVPVSKYIYNIDVDLNEPLRYSVVTDTEIPLYVCDTNTKFGNLGNFKNASCCKFRADGETVIVGTKTGDIMMIPLIRLGNIIRKLSVHNGAINKIEYLYKFDPIQKETVTIGDDGTLQVCDINELKVLHKFEDSKEPLRALAVHKKDFGVIATGSMDGHIRLYNIEVNSALMMSINTMMPVSCLSFPWESRTDIALSAGKSSVQLWNLSDLHFDENNQAIPVHSKTPHHMHIMDMCVSDGLYSGERVVFTAGLDGLVKVISLGDFREIFKYEYPSSLIAIRVFPHSQYLIVAGNDLGNNSQGNIYTRKLIKETSEDNSKKSIKKSTRKQEYQGIEHQKILALADKYNEDSKTINVIEHTTKTKLSAFDKLLKKHRHGKALTYFLRNSPLNKLPEYVQKVIRELDCLGVLQKAVAQQNFMDVTVMFRILRTSIWMPRFTRSYLRLLNIIIITFPFKWIAANREFAKLRAIIKKCNVNFKKFDQVAVSMKHLLLSCESHRPGTFARVDCSFPTINIMDDLK